MSVPSRRDDAASPYQAEGRLPAAVPSVVVFLDLLGYSAAMAATADDPAAATALLRALRAALDRGVEHLEDAPHAGLEDVTGGKRLWDLKGFTDNLVIGFPSFTGDDAEGGGDLGAIFSAVARFQLEMVRAGFFVRGAIAYGDLYIDRDVVFGAALIEAYQTESQVARDPRVVLAPSARRLMERHLRAYSSVEVTPHNHELLLDADGQLFLDYFGAWAVNADHEPGPDLAVMLEHKARIEQALREHAARPSVWTKYAWAARYHNFVCSEAGASLNVAHQITAAALSVGPQRLAASGRFDGIVRHGLGPLLDD